MSDTFYPTLCFIIVYLVGIATGWSTWESWMAGVVIAIHVKG